MQLLRSLLDESIPTLSWRIILYSFKRIQSFLLTAFSHVRTCTEPLVVCRKGKSPGNEVGNIFSKGNIAHFHLVFISAFNFFFHELGQYSKIIGCLSFSITLLYFIRMSTAFCLSSPMERKS